jgi:NitT/TauT family transport system permease protein
MSGTRRGTVFAIIALALLAIALFILLLVWAGMAPGSASAYFWLGFATFWAAAWAANHLAATIGIANPLFDRARSFAVPAVFGLTILALWELVCIGAGVPTVLMPAPSIIAAKFATSLPTLGIDFVQTVVRAVIPGWVVGSGLGILAAMACDRFGFLQRGLLPIGNFVSALPIIGIAPILVMWFGFDWQSKLAVVAIMTFFPALVNTVAGLASTGHLERDLMKSYGAMPVQTLLALKLPAAMPFIFNALKINATLALIGAIVAEFFGTPIIGMGFRISASIGQLDLPMIWAEITVAAITGLVFYGALALLERLVTFWHPSYRVRHA